MASRFKKHLLQQLYGLCRKDTSCGTHHEILSQFKTVDLGSIAVKTPLKIKSNNAESVIDYSLSSLPLIPDLIEGSVATHNKKIGSVMLFKSNPHIVMKDILESDPTELSFKKSKKKVIVEYSSPNVAKPFHMGHLRSTIIGNVIANVKKKLGEDVVTINYLGDWGTQFGLLTLGIKLARYTDEVLKENPIELLFQAYVKANKGCEENPELRENALKIFAELEEGNKDVLEQWIKIREWTIDYLKNMYERLGIYFDEYHWESSYGRKEINEILEKIKQKDILVTDDKNRVCAKIDDKMIPLVKSDGSTLYLARDVAAVYDRMSKHKFEEMYYVVENGQDDHFKNLFAICEKIGFDKSKKLSHIKFGRIEGLSTRKGSVIFLKDVFDKAKEIMLKEQEERLTTKIHDEDVADIVGISSIVINELKKRRQNSYKFDWSTACSVKAEGARLQYTHCRLHNLLEEYKDKIANECYPKALKEQEAIELACEISKYEEKILESDLMLEPCVLVQYLLKLNHLANIAYKNLNISGADSHIASQRLLLFNCSKRVLEDGLKLLGLRPLEKM